MRKFKKEQILKVLLVLLVILESMIFIIPIIDGMFGKIPVGDLTETAKPLSEPFYSLWIFTWVLSGILGITFIILIYLYGIPARKSQAEIIHLPFVNYESILECVRLYANNHHFSLLFSPEAFSPIELTIYIKKTGLWEETCIILIRKSGDVVDVLNTVNDYITDSLQAYYRKKIITNSINAITIFCIDAYDSQFRKIANQNVLQGLKNGRMPIVVSFNDKKIYIARQNDGYGKAKYKKLRRIFLEIMNIKSNH